MNDPNTKPRYEEYLEKQRVASVPTPKEIEWARRPFSSRVEPPKT